MRKSFLLLTTLFSLVTLGQNENAARLVPKYKKDEVIIRVNPNLLEHEIIDNPNIKQGSLNGFLNGKGKKEVDGIHGKPLDLPSLKVRKIFPDLRSCDRVSVSRQGKKVEIPPFWATFVVEKPKNMEYRDFMKGLKASYPIVLYAHPNFLYEPTDLPNDPLLYEQLSLDNPLNQNTSINMDSAWMIETGKQHIKVGVFDTGIDTSHLDLDVLTGYGYHYNNGDNAWGSDLYGHGTAVAGIIGAKRNNGIGIAGIAGGDGTDSSGVSLLDFKYGAREDKGVIEDIEFFSLGIVNAARSVGTKYDWTPFPDPNCPDGYPGYGIHIGNHSYGLALEVNTLPIEGDPIEDDLFLRDCDLCLESFLFSLKNGVINVVSRGNLNTNSGISPYHYPYIYPANYPDSWTICVGSTGSDGEWFYGPNNGDTSEIHFYSPIGRQLDLLAPGSTSVVATTASSKGVAGANNLYQKFNGTSAAAPHVSGVVALLLSYYNKPCYSNINLDPADVEYILEHSATDLLSEGYDDTTAYGRLNAYKALQMIQYPEYQIVHPTADPIQTQIVERDTIHIYLGSPLSLGTKGPLSNAYEFFSLEPNAKFRVERLKFQLTYDFSSYALGSTEIKDLWIRHGQTNSIGLIGDTIRLLEPVGTTGQYDWVTYTDTFDLAPMAHILNVDLVNKKVQVFGYYYHFMERFNPTSDFNGTKSEVDFWYPINPFIDSAEMTYSVYLHDPNFTERYDFPCDSANPLLDTNLVSIQEKINATEAFSIYPNPSTDQVTIQIKHLQPTEQKIRLLNTQGQLIGEKRFETGNKTLELNCNNFAPGIYFIQWWQNDQLMETKKWIKL